MKLKYRGNSCESFPPTQIDSNITNQPKIKLIYRGNTFDYIPRPEIVSEENETDLPTVTLIYRGNTYVRKLHPPKPYQKPRAINWRWQFK
jgi:Domain of unknown function (DUF4278)